MAKEELPKKGRIMDVIAKKQLTSTGGCYYASNYIGWRIAPTPWEALAGLDLVYSGNTPAIRSDKFKKVTKGVYLWYIPSWKDWSYIDNYAPVKKDGSRAGILLYGNKENDSWITNFLNEETMAITPTKM